MNGLDSPIYNTLKNNPIASFGTASKDGKIQALYKQLGMSNLGVPMLGDLRSDGANVHIRILNSTVVHVAVHVW